jgi:hypothetical protein
VVSAAGHAISGKSGSICVPTGDQVDALHEVNVQERKKRCKSKSGPSRVEAQVQPSQVKAKVHEHKKRHSIGTAIAINSGDKVCISKQGAQHQQTAVVLMANWAGRVKVRMDVGGGTQSFLSNELVLLQAVHGKDASPAASPAATAQEEPHKNYYVVCEGLGQEVGVWRNSTRLSVRRRSSFGGLVAAAARDAAATAGADISARAGVGGGVGAGAGAGAGEGAVVAGETSSSSQATERSELMLEQIMVSVEELRADFSSRIGGLEEQVSSVAQVQARTSQSIQDMQDQLLMRGL